MTRVAVVMPAYDAEGLLGRSLPPLLAAAGVREVLVVDPGSDDATAARARELGARVLELGRRAGPAEARNAGVAELPDADVVLFVDCDCVVHADVLERVTAAFDAEPRLVALSGSYDDAPPERNLASLYMNLRHHFTHQRARTEGASFWAGCGAVRRADLLAVGGFDAERYPLPMIEDIELGTRIAARGTTRLDPALQVTHLKRWTWASVFTTDVFRRALPWSRLILASGRIPDDLNVGVRERFAAVLAALALGLVAFGLVLVALGQPAGALAVVLGLALPFVLGARLFAFFADRGGTRFALVAFAYHQLHLVYSAAVFAYCKLEALLGGPR